MSVPDKAVDALYMDEMSRYQKAGIHLDVDEQETLRAHIRRDLNVVAPFLQAQALRDEAGVWLRDPSYATAHNALYFEHRLKLRADELESGTN